MGLPGQQPPLGRGSRRGAGHGPFGDKAFRVALAACAVFVVLGPVLLVVGGEGVRAAGTALLVLGALGLLTGGAGLLLEARMRREGPPAPPPADLARRNGRGPHPEHLPGLRKPPGRAP